MKDSKHPLTSKTIWTQILTLASAFFPVVQDWLATNPVGTVSFFAAVNVVVRFLTKGRISVFGGAVKGAANVLLCLCGLAALLLFAGVTTSCSRYPLEGQVYFRTPITGSKAGVNFDLGRPPLPFFRPGFYGRPVVVVEEK